MVALSPVKRHSCLSSKLIYGIPINNFEFKEGIQLIVSGLKGCVGFTPKR